MIPDGRNMLIYKAEPCRTTGSGKVSLTLLFLFHKFLGFSFSSNLSAFSHFHNLSKSNGLHSLLYLLKAAVKLAFNGRSNHSNHLLAFIEHLSNRNKSASLGNGTKWAGSETAATTDTLIRIDFGNTVLILLYSSYRTGVFTRNTVMDNGMEWTALHTFTTLYTLICIDVGLSVYILDCILGTVCGTRSCKTTSTSI